MPPWRLAVLSSGSVGRFSASWDSLWPRSWFLWVVALPRTLDGGSHSSQTSLWLDVACGMMADSGLVYGSGRCSGGRLTRWVGRWKRVVTRLSSLPSSQGCHVQRGNYACCIVLLCPVLPVALCCRYLGHRLDARVTQPWKKSSGLPWSKPRKHFV